MKQLNKTQRKYLTNQKEYSIIKDIVETKNILEEDLDIDFDNLYYNAILEDEEYYYFLRLSRKQKFHDWESDYNYNFIIKAKKSDNKDYSLYKLQCDIKDLILEKHKAEKIYFEKTKRFEYIQAQSITLEESKKIKEFGGHYIIKDTNKYINHACKVLDENGEHVYQIYYLMENERQNGLCGYVIKNLKTNEIRSIESEVDEESEKYWNEYWNEWEEEKRLKEEKTAQEKKERREAMFEYWNYSKKELSEMGQDVLADALEDEELFENSNFGEVIDY